MVTGGFGVGADGGEHATNPTASMLLVLLPGGSFSQLGGQRHREGSPEGQGSG